MEENNRERDICKAWAKEADSVDELKALCRQLAEAIQTVPYDSYSDALRDGCDANGAWDCFCGAMKKWKTSALEGAKTLAGLE